jgi:hypothetical protein
MYLSTLLSALNIVQDGGVGVIEIILIIAIILVVVAIIGAILAGLWQTFVKAGEAGWKGIIPFYNIWVLMEIIGRPGWWLILFFIPVVGFIIWIIVCLDVAKSFDHGTGFAIGLMIFPFIFFIILGWGESQYQGALAGK